MNNLYNFLIFKNRSINSYEINNELLINSMKNELNYNIGENSRIVIINYINNKMHGVFLYISRINRVFKYYFTNDKMKKISN